jgi:diaminopimelate decarboxylase
MGGGFPTPRDPMGRSHPNVAARRPSGLSPTPESYAREITAGLREAAAEHGLSLEGVTLEIEPGRGLFSQAGVHLATVVRLKSQQRPFQHQWVELDTTECHFGNSEASRWNVLLANRSGGSSIKADIVGCSCNLDRMVADAVLPEPRVGDTIAFLDAGAYQEATASNFNALVRPATVLVTGDRAEVIRSRESLESVLARDIVPTHLGALPDAIAQQLPRIFNRLA